MEILLTAIALITIFVLVVLVGTRGRPMRFFYGFKEMLSVAAANYGPLAVTAGGIITVVGFVYFFYAHPVAGLGPEQPIPFSHRLHAGIKDIDCNFCHSFVDRSIHPGIPPVEKCLFCHNHIISGHPEIKNEIAYFDNQKPVPWRKVYYLAEHVLFNHERHIKKDVACESCHGDVRTMDRLKGNRFEMGFCLKCHREKGAELDCWIACHS